MFDRDRFIADCRAALPDGTRAMREVVARAVADPTALMRGLGATETPGFEVLHAGPDLTVLNIRWRVGQIVMPHNHEMWAVIGVYSGREDNILWRRRADDPNGTIEAAGAKSLAAREAIAFGADVIHSVTNPVPRITGALHVYGGDFFGISRSEWDPQSLHEQAYDIEKAQRMLRASEG